MKIPVYEQRQVGPQSVALPVQQVRVGQGQDAIGQGLRQADSGIQSMHNAMERDEAKRKAEEEKARASVVTDAETELTRQATGELHGDSASGTKGYLSLEGRAAEADGAGVMERIEKHRQDIAEGLKDEEAKKLFQQRTGRQIEAYRGSVETHASHQRKVADVATVKARMEAAEKAMYAAALVDDGETVGNQSIALESSIAALAVSPEDAQHDLNVWRGRTVAVQLDAQLERAKTDPKRLDQAETLLKDGGGLLTEKQKKEYGDRIEKVRSAGVAEANASRIVAAATDDDGQLNQAKALKLFNELPPEEQEKARPALFQRMTEQEQAYNADTKRISTASFSLYNAKGWAEFDKSGLSTELNARNPELYHRLREDSQQEAARLKRKASGDHKGQKAVDTVAVNTFKALPDNVQRETNIEEWAKGRGMSPEAISELGPLQKSAAERVDKGGSLAKDAYVGFVLARAQGYIAGGATAKERKERREEVAARAGDDYSQLFYEHEGRVPGAEAKKKQGQQLVEILGPTDPNAGKALKEMVDQPKASTVRVRKKNADGSLGQEGTMPAANFDPSKYELIRGR